MGRHVLAVSEKGREKQRQRHVVGLQSYTKSVSHSLFPQTSILVLTLQAKKERGQKPYLVLQLRSLIFLISSYHGVATPSKSLTTERQRKKSSVLAACSILLFHSK